MGQDFIQSLFNNGLSGDHSGDHSRRQTLNVCFSSVQPTAVSKPQLVLWSKEVAELLQIDVDPSESNDLLARTYSGSSGSGYPHAYAMRYGGHQFGHWAGQLGDGRAIILGERIGQDQRRYEVQLKGAGVTPYSRTADGRAVLRSSIREYVASEAMHYLRVPTTRALSLAVTGEDVLRDMFYDGNPALEKGAIVTRVAPSFIRFGNFEIHAAHGELDLLRKLVEFTVTHYYPNVRRSDFEETLQEFFRAVCEQTSRLVVDWMRVGFIHGVLNTDNCSVLGLTIDYGPYGWLDAYDPNFTPNTTDETHRRYRYGAQPDVMGWNLSRFGSALAYLTKDHISLSETLKAYRDETNQALLRMWFSKLGFTDTSHDLQSSARAKDLVEDLKSFFQGTKVDYYLFFRELAKSLEDSLETKVVMGYLRKSFYEDTEENDRHCSVWVDSYRTLIREVYPDCGPMGITQMVSQMNNINPYFIPRNYILQNAYESLLNGDQKPLDEVMQALRSPYQSNGYTDKFYMKTPLEQWGRPGCSKLSCSS